MHITPTRVCNTPITSRHDTPLYCIYIYLVLNPIFNTHRTKAASTSGKVRAQAHRPKFQDSDIVVMYFPYIIQTTEYAREDALSRMTLWRSRADRWPVTLQTSLSPHPSSLLSPKPTPADLSATLPSPSSPYSQRRSSASCPCRRGSRRRRRRPAAWRTPGSRRSSRAG